MDLTESQAKRVLASIGVVVPDGRTVNSVEEAAVAFAELGGSPCVLKAQIHAGGRALGHFSRPVVDKPGNRQGQGGIRFVDAEGDVRQHSRQMLGATLITNQTGPAGERVESLYLEKCITVKRELYVALTIDREAGHLIFLASPDGGKHIEQQSLRDSGGTLRSWPVDLHTRDVPPDISQHLHLDVNAARQLQQLLAAILEMFIDRDATLVEINPLGVDHQGQLIALDAVVVWDDNALFRQGHEEQLSAYDSLHPVEYEALRKRLNYVRLGGDIGSIAVGAGLAMATIDAICDAGGNPANFLDVSPSASIDDLCNAIQLLLDDSSVHAILINVFGGGIMRCDIVVHALLKLRAATAEPQPFDKTIVLRVSGVNAGAARQQVVETMPELMVTANVSDAAQFIVGSLTNGKAEAAIAHESRGRKRGIWSRVRGLLPETQQR